MIECEGLTKRFGNFTAVDHVSFSVTKGSIFGFLGPNGSGKSTAFKASFGMLPVTWSCIEGVLHPAINAAMETNANARAT